MISNLYTIISNSTNPYENLAFEESLLHNLKNGEVIMYLWQNKNTVVIGKNQNCRAECKVEALKGDGGFLARRPSGGGAVFHDLGNLNFTFLAKADAYDVQKQLDVIITAVRTLGLDAKKSGRNDISIDDRKFSGNAFYSARDNKFHHGTILLNADLTKLANYLTVSADKLKAHGVKSVRSRVVNLSELNPNITLPMLKNALIDAFDTVYGLNSQPLSKDRLDKNDLSQRFEKFSSDTWLYGVEREYNYIFSRRFDWGSAELAFSVEGSIISEVEFFTDALNDKLSEMIKENLLSQNFSKSALVSAFDGMAKTYPQAEKEFVNIIEMIKTDLE